MREVAEGIVVDPEVMDGAPVIKGTRVPVEVVLRTHAENIGIEEVCKEFGLDRPQVLNAISYAADMVSGGDSGTVSTQQVKFMLAEDIPNSAVQPFKDNGYEAIHVRDEEPGTGLDREMYANEEGYILVTRDKSLMEVDRGLVLLDLSTHAPVEVKQRLDRFLDQIDPGEIEETVTVVEDTGYHEK